MRHSLKFWWRHRSAALWMVGSLGLAIGLTTAAWSLADAAWFRPLPGETPSDLVSIGFRSDQTDRGTHFSFADYLALADRQDVFTGVAAISTEDDWFLDGRSDQLALNAGRVTSNVLDVLGVTPLVGRSFSSEDFRPGVPEVAILSFRLWRSAFGRSEAVIDQRVMVSVPYGGGTHPMQVIAVLPPEVVINGPDGVERDVLVSLPEEWRSNPPKNRGGSDPTLIARLRRGITISAADAHMTPLLQAIDRQLPSALPSGAKVRGSRSSFLLPLHEFWYGSARDLLVRLGGVAALVMVVACTNVFGVLFALASTRSREFAIRGALGESPRRMWSMAVVELTPVALGATTLSILSARGFVEAFVRFAPSGLPRLVNAHVDWQVATIGLAAAFATLASMGIAVAFLQSRRVRLATDLQGAGFSSAPPAALHVRRVLIAAQIGVVLALLTATSLVAGSLWRLLYQPLGFDISRVMSAGIVATRDYFNEPGRYMQFIDDLRREVLAAPGGRQVAVTVDPPLGRAGQFTRVTFLDGHYRPMETKSVSDGYFGVMGIPILAGRDFVRSDRDGCALLVNATFARTYFGGIAGAIGQQVILGGNHCGIVGVSGDVREGPLAEPMAPAIYPVFSAGRNRRQIYIVTREEGSLESEVRPVHDAIRRADSTAYVTVAPLAVRVSTQTAAARIGMIGLGTLGGFTLLLACLGIAATVAQVSAERRRDLAIRRALGASNGSVVLLMMRVVAWPTAWGLLIGAMLSWWSGPLVGRLLFQTSPFDPGLWLMGICVLVTVVGLAAWIPARAIREVNPITVLRQE